MTVAAALHRPQTAPGTQLVVVVGLIAEQEPPDSEPEGQDVTVKEESTAAKAGADIEQTPDGRRVVRRRSRSGS